MEFRTYIEAEIPRVDCPEHGILNAKVPWADRSSRYTFSFESSVLALLKLTTIKHAADFFRLSWEAVDGIMERAVNRGIAKRNLVPVRHLGLDEVSYQSHHQYSTILFDQDESRVIDVLDDRTKEALLGHLDSQKSLYSGLETVSMDMWEPYLAALREFDPEVDNKVCFDRFHVARLFSKALDQIRADEHRKLMSEDDERLKYTRFDWLRSAFRIDNRDRRWFMKIARSNLKTARGWAMKETAGQLWDFSYRGAAEKAWKALVKWMSLGRLEPMKKVGKTIRFFLWGILNAIIAKVTNASSESVNALIQKIKARACGFRNRKRFKRAILFYLGKLDMTPAHS